MESVQIDSVLIRDLDQFVLVHLVRDQFSPRGPTHWACSQRALLTQEPDAGNGLQVGDLARDDQLSNLFDGRRAHLD